ncbi:MAG: hypothetical protein IJD93_00110 [Ruminococcus sp.]|nr:hypothetical protein [Ruminococcus sp.]
MIGKEYIRDVEGADTAVLFLHGFMSTPNEFLDFLPLVPKEFTLHNILLDGHCKGVLDFAKSSMKKWEAQAEEAFSQLAKTHENIIVVGHSMGSLLALSLTLKHTEKVVLPFLVNTPLTPRCTFKFACNAMRVIFSKVRPDHPDEVAASETYGVTPDKRLWLYLSWIPRFRELFIKAKNTIEQLPLLKSKCIAFQSVHDELVSNRSEEILRQNPNIKTFTFKESTHYLYNEDEKQYMLKVFERECKKLRKVNAA